MPKARPRTPKYRHYKPKNLAVVRIAGRDHYLRKYGSPESYERYDRLIAEWLVARHQAPAANGLASASSAARSITVNELVLAYWHHAKQRYVKNGQPTSEIRSFKTALRPVRQLYGSVPVTDFGPLALVACRVKLIEVGICRKRINQHIGRIRQMFRWGVGRELVPETVWRALLAIEGLRIGEAIERPPVRAVSDERIAAIEHFVTPQIWAMVNLQIWSACRPGEACIIRAIDINMQGNIWEYRPHSHKGEHHGKERVIYLGPHAQEIIKPWLTTDLHAYLFSPKEGRAWCQAQRAKHRKTPKPKKERKFQRKSQPQRAPGERYNVHAYDHAICRGCELAFGMPAELRKISKHLDADERKRLGGLATEWRERHCWHPNQLRHTVGTRIRAAYGIELARVILGHSSVTTLQIYAEIDREKAKEVMGKMG